MTSFPTTGQNPQWGPQLKAYIDERDVLPDRLSEEGLSAAIEAELVVPSAHTSLSFGATLADGSVELPTLNRHNAFPGLARLADGRWIAVWRGAWDHAFTADGVLVMSFSDDGKRWDTPTVVNTNVATYGEVRDPSVTVTPSGEVLLVFYAAGTQRSYLMRSTNNGATFSAPVDLPYPAGLAFQASPIVVLPSGRWLAAAYNGDGTNKAIIIRSDDQGATWATPLTLTPVAPLAGYQEPNLISLGGNNVLMTIRAQTGQRIYTSTSSNGGQTWTTVVDAFFGTNNPRLVRFSSGTITVGYRHPYHGGFMLRSSFDNGATWTRPFHVGQSLTFMGNMSAVEIAETPGQALALWASEDNGPCSLAASVLSESGGLTAFGPAPHPSMQAAKSSPRDRLFLPAKDFTPVAGSPVMGNVFTNPGYLMDAAGSEAVSCLTTIPDDWRRFNVILWFASTDANTGTVVWDSSYGQFQDDGTLSTGTFVNGGGIAFTDAVQGDVRSTTLHTNLTNAERGLWLFRIIRDGVNASDTYAVDALFIGLELVRKP